MTSTACCWLLVITAALGCAEAPARAPLPPAAVPAAAPPAPALEQAPLEVEIVLNANARCSTSGSSVQVIIGIPTKLGVRRGRNHVVCSAAGHEDAETDVAARPGETPRVSLELKPKSPAGSVTTEPHSGLQFVYIPAGHFHFGCEPQDTACAPEEKPGHDEQVRALRFGKTDVTVAAFAKCVAAGNCAKAGRHGKCNAGTNKLDHPINCVDADSQAAAFCDWIGGRLPTAVEWEYAAKSGESRIYPWGDEPPTPRLAKFASYDGTAAAGSRPDGATKLGLLDMAGNVWQWTATSDQRVFRELRGGGWADPAGDLRASHRSSFSATVRHTDIGFRCVL